MSNRFPSFPMSTGQDRRTYYGQDTYAKATPSRYSRYEDRSSFSSSPARSSSPRTPHATRHYSAHAYIRSSPEIPADAHFRGKSEHYDDLSSSWGYRYARNMPAKYSAPAYNRVSHYKHYRGEDNCPPTSDFDISEFSEDLEHDIPDVDSEPASDSAPAQSSGVYSDSEEEDAKEDDEEDGETFRYGYDGPRRTFFHTSAERGQWKSNPLPMKPTPTSLLQTRKSVPTLSRIGTPTLTNPSRTISEPAPSTSVPESSFLLAPLQDQADRTTGEASAFADSSESSPVSDSLIESTDSLPSLSSDRESSMGIDEHDMPSSPLPPSSPPLSPIGLSVSLISRSVSPLSFACNSPKIASSSPLSEPSELGDDENTAQEPLMISSVLNVVPPVQPELPSISDESSATKSPALPLDSVSEEVKVDVVNKDTNSSPSSPSLPEHPSGIEDVVVEQSTSILPVVDGVPLVQDGILSPKPAISLETSTSIPSSIADDKAIIQEDFAVSEVKTDMDQSVPTVSISIITTTSSSEKRKKQHDSEVRPKKKRKIETSLTQATEEVSLSSTKTLKEKAPGKRKAEEQHDSENTPEVDPAPKPKKKRATTDASTVASTSAPAPIKRVSKTQRSRIRASSIHHDASDKEPDLSQPLDAETIALHAQVCGLLIETMAMSRASSLPVSSLFKSVMQQQPALRSQRTEKEWTKLFDRVLHSGEAGRGSGVFGKVESSGKDDADRPLEAQWFYVPELDEDQERATLIKAMMPRPAKRSETKKYKQYYWRPLDKISKWDPEDEL